MSLDSEIKVLTERLSHFVNKIDDLEKKIDKMDQNLEKFKDKMEEKIDHINSVKIPSITEELSSLRTKAMIAGGIFGTLGYLATSLVLWIVQTWHR